jgi:hypothetical protein
MIFRAGLPLAYDRVGGDGIGLLWTERTIIVDINLIAATRCTMPKMISKKKMYNNQQQR